MLGTRDRPTRIPLALTALLLTLALPARAADILINNGQDCSSPGNVIDDATYQSDTVYVRNVGCGTPDPWSSCSDPGTATEVCVAAGGLVDQIYAYDSSVATVSGGAITSSVIAHDTSAIAMNGGSVDTVGAYDSSTMAMGGGMADFLFARGSSVATMTGGTVVNLLDAGDSGAVTLSGGDVDTLRAYESSTITITGWQFEVDGSPVPFGALAAQTGTLTGKLALSVHPISSVFYQGGGSYTGTITLVYAPSLPALPAWGYVALAGGLIAGGAALARKRSVAART